MKNIPYSSERQLQVTPVQERDMFQAPSLRLRERVLFDYQSPLKTMIPQICVIIEKYCFCSGIPRSNLIVSTCSLR